MYAVLSILLLLCGQPLLALLALTVFVLVRGASHI